MRRLPQRLSVGLLLATLSLAGAAYAQTVLPDLSHRMTRVAKPIPAKNFTFKDLDGKPHSLADYPGKVILVNFWATWCPPCRREMPSMERLYQRLKGEPFMIIAVDQFETEDLVFAFTGQLDPLPTFPILLDPKSQASRDWDVKGLPTSFLVDKHGRIAYRAIGGRDFEHPEMEKLIRDLISEK